MNTPSQKRALLAAVLGVPLLFAAIWLLQTRIDAQTRTVAHEKEDLMLRSPEAVRKMGLGYDSLLADIYWTRAVQYYGSRVGTTGAKFDLLWPLLDITTTLDPRLVVAYRFGAIFLSEPGIGGAGRTGLAIELVKRGIAANPNEWHLDSDLAFLYYWRMQDYTDASNAYLEGSKNPDAPIWLKMMAARVLEKGGSLETSRIIWSEIYDSTKDPKVKARAETMLAGLKAEEDEQQLDRLAEQYRQRFGRYPASTGDMLSAGLLPGIPLDPAGYPYVFGPDGKAALNAQTSVLIPEAPKSPPGQAK